MHPDVEPFVSLGQDIPDLEAVIDDHQNVCLMNKHGGFLFQQVEPGTYEVHTAFVPEGRGPHVVELARRAVAYMFEQVGADEIRTFVAYDNLPAMRLAEAVGFSVLGECEHFGIQGVNMVLSEYVCQ